MKTRIASADVALTWDGSIVTMRASGVLTGSVCLQMHKRLLRAVRTTTASGAVVDLRTALLAMSQTEHADLLRATQINPIQKRIAFLASPWAMRYRDTYARVMGKRGLDRRFFEEEAAA